MYVTYAKKDFRHRPASIHTEESIAEKNLMNAPFVAKDLQHRVIFIITE